MSRWRWTAVALVVLAASLLGWWLMPREPEPARPQTALAQALGGEAEGFARAYAPRPLHFPADHGPHPDYRSEWWYVTGNVQDSGGRHFGFELTIFRFGLAPGSTQRPSRWAANHFYMAHFAVTDTAGGRFHDFERFARGAQGLAGAQAAPFRVWLEDWEMAGADGPFPLRLRAAEDGVAVDLTLEPRRPLVLQGNQGLSRKSAEPGNASYYYSMTRLGVRGTLALPAGDHHVRGLAWLDREWSTSALAQDQAGWDWFALQLDDGRDVMFYRLRKKDGSKDPHSGGVVVKADGTVERLAAGDATLAPLTHWESPQTGVRYPIAWRLTLPGQNLDLEVRAVLPQQELDAAVRYWEGAVTVAGSASGRGYLELAGY